VTNNFTVIVREVNLAPALSVIATQTVNELTLLTVTNTATESNIHSALGYALLTKPAGMSIDTNGIITWTPQETNSSSTNLVTTVATSSNPYDLINPQLFVTNNFTVIVREVDFAPQNFSIFSITQTNIAGTNGFLIAWVAPTNAQFHLQWTRSLAPMNWSNFNGVIGCTSFITATNGTFEYFDDGSQTGGFGSIRFYRLLSLNSPSNTAPFLLHTPSRFYASPMNLFVFTNTAQDWDLPAQTLTYSVTNTLAGTKVVINPSSGVVAWTPDLSLLGQTNIIITTVTDNGWPPMSAVNSFAVVVSTNTIAAPVFNSIMMAANGVKFQWTAATNQQFQIRWTTNLAPADWHLFPDTNLSTTGNFVFMDTNMPLALMKFYQLILLPCH